MNTIQTKNIPDRSLVNVIGNDANGNTGKMPIGIGVGASLLGKLVGMNLNTTADQLITLSGGTKFVVTDIIMQNFSRFPLNTESGGQFWTGSNRTGYNNYNVTTGGDTLLTANSILSAHNFAITLNQLVAEQYVGNSYYFSLTTPEGSAATCDCYVFGIIIE